MSAAALSGGGGLYSADAIAAKVVEAHTVAMDMFLQSDQIVRGYHCRARFAQFQMAVLENYTAAAETFEEVREQIQGVLNRHHRSSPTQTRQFIDWLAMQEQTCRTISSATAAHATSSTSADTMVAERSTHGRDVDPRSAAGAELGGSPCSTISAAWRFDSAGGRNASLCGIADDTA